MIYIIILIFISFIVIELNHRAKPSSPLILKPYKWDVVRKERNLLINALIRIDNPHKRMEVMIPKISIKAVPLGDKNYNNLKILAEVIPNHIDEETRKDNYWVTYIVKSQNHTTANLKIEIESLSETISELKLTSIWIEIHWINYGPFGRLCREEGFVVPLYQSENYNKADHWTSLDNGINVLPIKTHILGSLDNPYEILKRYSAAFLKEGDILTLGETPLAIMQGRYLLPQSVKTNLLTRVLCRGFHPTSSLATACGMQSLIDIVGPSRIICSWLIGAALKTLGVKGMFYRLAGSQARLIDDITGTTPPYDQTIVLGPINPELFCYKASIELGVTIAIVDVNDLGKVKILAISNRSDEAKIKNALISNPAGNANQHTPIVVIRP
tara:strand:+ start:1226 stop:2380 length:1155 start_codon:yes stop_codon:yes gene_type:complete